MQLDKNSVCFEKIPSDGGSKIRNSARDVNEETRRLDFIQEHEVGIPAGRYRSLSGRKFFFLRKAAGIIEQALAAARALRKTHCPPKPDEISMKRVRFPRRN